MLGTLLESNARRPRRRAGLVASIAIHTLVIGAGLAATAAATSRDRHQAEAPPTIVYTPPSPAAPTSPRETQTRPVVPDPSRLPQPGRTITFVPDSLLRRTIDVDSGKPFELDTGAPPCLIRCEVRSDRGTGEPRGLGNMPATVATVDRAAALISPARPRYPEQLRSAGVTGRVIVRLVVDTIGRVEPATIVVRESSHDLFASAILAILPSLRFAPAEAGGRKVRMLVDLPFEFRLNE